MEIVFEVATWIIFLLAGVFTGGFLGAVAGPAYHNWRVLDETPNLIPDKDTWPYPVLVAGIILCSLGTHTSWFELASRTSLGLGILLFTAAFFGSLKEAKEEHLHKMKMELAEIFD